MTAALPRILAVLLLLTIGLSACSGADSESADDLPDDALLHDLRNTGAEAEVVLVRVSPGPGRSGVEPDRISLAEGAVLRFVMTGGVPNAIVFDTTNLSTEARTFLRERSLVRGPLLLSSGQTYDVDLRGAPPGRYEFGFVLRSGEAAGGMVEVGVVAEGAPAH